MVSRPVKHLVHNLLLSWPVKLNRYNDSRRAGRSGDRIPMGSRFSAHVQTAPGAHPASYTMGTGFVHKCFCYVLLVMCVLLLVVLQLEWRPRVISKARWHTLAEFRPLNKQRLLLPGSAWILDRTKQLSSVHGMALQSERASIWPWWGGGQMLQSQVGS